MHAPSDDLDFELLRKIEELNNTNQRDLAERLGVSVGKVKICLRAVVHEGWVKVNDFKRADNQLAYAYLLTPSGASAKVSLAREFLQRKEAEFEALRQVIDQMDVELKALRIARNKTVDSQKFPKLKEAI